MANPTMMIEEVYRITNEGNTESVIFTTGVNLLVGAPNTGKTKWLETIDFILGDDGAQPFAHEGEGLSEKYSSAGLRLIVDSKAIHVERKWCEPGNKTKIFVDGTPMVPREFQHLLMQRLGIPILQVPSGDPYSGRTWPELSFRTVLRHIYRQQKLWNSLVDKQPDDSVRASVQLLLGLAEHLYSHEYAEIVRIRTKIARLSARKEQFSDTLSELARDFLGEDRITVSITESSIISAINQLESEYKNAVETRETMLKSALESEVGEIGPSYIVGLIENRSFMLAKLENYQEVLAHACERLDELKSYKATLMDEVDRFRRADSASRILSDLRITHCPACDQTVTNRRADDDNCFLCHQSVHEIDLPKEMASQRVDFEKTRISAELSEAEELVASAAATAKEMISKAAQAKESLREFDRELAPARGKISALIQESVSAIDQKLGSLLERIKQLRRIESSFALQSSLEANIQSLEDELAPILARNLDIANGLDYARRASWLEDGMNDYLNSLNQLRPQTWRHSAVTIHLSRSTLTFRIGTRRWDVTLGGTDSLYYLMAYHYGLMSLHRYEATHFPGFSIIDIPPDFAGETIGSTENFVVQPFIDLLNSKDFENCQFIITGAAFEGLQGVNRIQLNQVWLA